MTVRKFNPPTNRAVEYVEVCCEIGRNRILRSINLGVATGETLVLLGRSGSGKTTALKLVNRLLEPTKGSIHVEGRPTRDWSPVALRRRIGYVIQEVGLLPHYNVGRNVGLVPTLEGWERRRIQGRVEEMLVLVGLNPAEFMGRMPHELSGGQRQRVGVARALASDPSILLMDEPFGALDPLTRQELQSEFLALKRTLNRTVLLVTHDVAEALLLGDRIAVLEAGRIHFCGTRSQFLSSGSPIIQSFVRPLRRLALEVARAPAEKTPAEEEK